MLLTLQAVLELDFSRDIVLGPSLGSGAFGTVYAGAPGRALAAARLAAWLKGAVCVQGPTGASRWQSRYCMLRTWARNPPRTRLSSRRLQCSAAYATPTSSA